MDVITIVLILFTLICALIYFQRGKTKEGLPPLIAGSFTCLRYLLFKKQTARDYGQVTQVGDVYRVSFGVDIIVLNSHRAVQEAFANQGDVFSGRQRDGMSILLGNRSGIVGSDGSLWQEHRRFMLRVLRDFGMGKSILCDLIQDEIRALVELVSSANGSPLITQDIFSAAINNVIGRLTFGERSGTDDVHFKEFTRHVDGMFETKVGNVLPFLFPGLIKIPFLKSRFPIVYHNDYINSYIKEKIWQQSLSINAMKSPPTDVDQATNICEAFLIEQAKQEKTNPGDHTFTDWQIIRNMSDIFLAGTDTTATTLSWAMLLMATHPEAQQRVHQEIEEKIGRQRTPMMSDRLQLPYVSAAMDEVMRCSSIIPLNVLHRTLQDTVLLGFDIPSNTLIQTNIYGIHHDPRHWARPYEFYPQHFFSEEGNYTPSKFLIPFSLGKRACLGESLARMEYFIAFVTLMQKFEVRLENSNADVEAILEGSMGIVRHPLPHKIVFQPLDA